MNNDKSKSKLSTIALILLLTLSATLVALPSTTAHSPPWKYRLYARIHIAPDPVGVMETVLIVAAVNWALPGGNYFNDIRPEDVTITIEKPDETIISYPFDRAPDSGGSAFITYTPDMAGTYTVTAVYSDTVYHWNSTNTPGLSSMYNQYYGDIWYGSTATKTFAVQEDPVGNTVVWSLPTEYWTRPISGDNYAWQSISSNWLSGASVGGASISTGVAEGSRWQKDGAAPHSAHIMWTNPIEFGGVVGGESIQPTAAYYSGMSYQTRFNSPIIISGTLFYPQALGAAGSGGGYVAVDLRTGEELWRRDDINPTKGQLIDFGSGNQHGVVGAILWQEGPRGTNAWYAYDAFTGKNLFNLTDVPNGYEFYDTDTRYAVAGATVEESGVFQVTIAGDITQYIIDYSTTSDSGILSLWSDTQVLSRSDISFSGVNGLELNASTGYVWNVSLPNLDGQSSPRIVGVIPGDILVGTSSTITLNYLPRTTHDDPWIMWAISLKPESRGQLLWKKDYPKAPGNITRMLTMVPVDPVNRVWTMKDFDTGNIMGFSIDNGEMLWNTFPNGDATQMATYLFRPMQFYSVREGIGAYGILYVSGYGGEIFAFSTNNGTLLWKFNATSTTSYTSGIPWGLQPLHVGAMADGLVYGFAGEHSPGTPLYTGYRMFAVDAFTGEKVWDLFGWSSSGLGTSIAPVAIADGYLAFYNCYDGRIYSIGKGPSATTVSIQDDVISLGSSVMIKGTVMDIAAGTTQDEQAARFPNGVPAVADEDMSEWMEYVYMQKSRPADATGVTVKLEAVDPNNHYQDYGTTTSDAYGNYGFTFKPDVEGKYMIIATFEGSSSYYGSITTTYLTVGPAAGETDLTPLENSVSDVEASVSNMTTYLLAILAVVIIALLIAVYSLLKSQK